MGLIDERREETPVERNARLQAAFNKASASMPTTTAPDVPATYNVQDIQGQSRGDVSVPHLDVPYEQWKANTPAVTRGEFPSSLELVQQRQSSLEQRQYTLPQFGTTPTPSKATTQWGEIPFAMMRDAASYTSQSLFGGYDVRTGGLFEGAYDRQGNLINPGLQPNMLTPELAQLMWPYASEAIRVSLGYNPEAPYELLEPVDAGGGVAGGGGGGGGGGRSIGSYPSSAGTGVPRFSGWGLTMWRIT